MTSFQSVCTTNDNPAPIVDLTFLGGEGLHLIWRRRSRSRSRSRRRPEEQEEEEQEEKQEEQKEED